MAYDQPSPKNFVERPLNRGVILNRPSQYLPTGAVVDAANYIVGPIGPYRRPGDSLYNVGSTDYTMVDLATLWNTSGTQVQILITDRTLFEITVGSGMNEIEDLYDDGSVTIVASSTEVNGASCDWSAASNDIQAGDILRIGTVTSGDFTSLEESEIESITDSNTLIVDSELSEITGSGTSYQIIRTVNDSTNYLSDWVVFNNNFLIVDHRRPIRQYSFAGSGDDAGSLSEYATGTNGILGSEDVIAGTIAYFNDRVFIADTVETTDGSKRQRIRWSSQTDNQDFSVATAYIDLPYSSGNITKLLPMGNLLVVYLTDSIYIGTITNMPELPVSFQRIETGGIGLVGKKAVCSWIDRHFFIGQDNIYQLSQEGIEPIGAPIVKNSIDEATTLERSYAVPDPSNRRIVFGFQKDADKMEELWSFSYDNGAWSRDTVSTFMIALPEVVTSAAWSSYSSTEWDDMDGAWDDLSSGQTRKRLYLEDNGGLRRLSAVGDSDYDSDIITAILETRDYDEGAPDVNKTWTRLSVKIDEPVGRTEDIIFQVQGSADRGRTWKTLGTMTLGTDDDEGEVSFRITSSHIRFKLVSGSVVPPYWVSEIGRRVTLRGNETTVQLQG